MTPTRESPQPKVGETAVSIPIQWGTADHLPTIYANQLFISHAGPEFYLIFGELVPPIVLGEGKFPDIVEIKPVAKIAVSPESMLRIAEAIANNVQRFKERPEKGE
jgi:hypothetical protein